MTNPLGPDFTGLEGIFYSFFLQKSGYVASCADVNTSHISNIENNRVKVSLTTLVHMCNALDVTVDYVLHNEYVNSQSPLENSILIELQHCDKQKQERMLKLISVLKEHDLL